MIKCEPLVDNVVIREHHVKIVLGQQSARGVYAGRHDCNSGLQLFEEEFLNHG